MPAFETIVRPFVGQETTPKPGVASIPAIVPNVVVIIGMSGSGKTMNGSFSSSTTLYSKKYPKEKKAT